MPRSTMSPLSQILPPPKERLRSDREASHQPHPAFALRHSTWTKPDALLRGRAWRFLLPALAVTLSASILYGFHPEHYAFYPKCLLYHWTGWQCPGCGGLRAAYHLLHGHFSTAFFLNPFLMLLGGALALTSLADGFRRLGGLPAKYLLWWRQPAWIWTLLGLAVLFGIARNLPWF